jgi:uncharacterized membrane protein (DUF4010 family)
MDPVEAYKTLGIALSLGLLVGLQRGKGSGHIAGLRTFPLITVLGTISAMLAPTLGVWMPAATLLGVVAMVIAGEVIKSRLKPDPGITTDISALIMFVVGAMLAAMPELALIPIAVSIVLAVLLASKDTMHGFAGRLDEKDVRAILQFAVITFIVLPILPDRSLELAIGSTGEWLNVLNPRQVWWMVVLVVGISLTAYVGYKALGTRAGAALAGTLGGVVSSTATTVSFAKRVNGDRLTANVAALVILLASSVMYVRMGIEVAVVGPDFFGVAAPRLAALGLVSLLVAGAFWVQARRALTDLPAQENPSELKAAVWFGVAFAVVYVAVSAGNHFLGDSGVYLVAALSGTTTIRAITLSMSHQVQEGLVSAEVGWRVLVVASMGSVVFKVFVAGMLGGRRLLVRVGPPFLVVFVVGVLMLIW